MGASRQNWSRNFPFFFLTFSSSVIIKNNNGTYQSCFTFLCHDIHLIHFFQIFICRGFGKQGYQCHSKLTTLFNYLTFLFIDMKSGTGDSRRSSSSGSQKLFVISLSSSPSLSLSLSICAELRLCIRHKATKYYAGERRP